MERYETEEQQVEAIKQFWKDHGMAIIVGALLGLGGLYGWRWYTDKQIQSHEMASTSYQAAVETLGQADGENKLDAFIKANPDSGYASLAGLVAANQAIADKNYDAAASYLNSVATHAADAHIATVASLRLARVQLEMNQPDAALSTLGAIKDDAFSAQIEELKGDAYVSQAQFDMAREAYTAALEKSTNNRLLQMKLDNLSVAAGA